MLTRRDIRINLPPRKWNRPVAFFSQLNWVLQPQVLHPPDAYWPDFYSLGNYYSPLSPLMIWRQAKASQNRLCNTFRYDSLHLKHLPQGLCDASSDALGCKICRWSCVTILLPVPIIWKDDRCPHRPHPFCFQNRKMIKMTKRNTEGLLILPGGSSGKEFN